jgi:hypothetical protein
VGVYLPPKVTDMSNTITVNPNKLYTKSKYSELFKINRVSLDKKIKLKEIKIIEINGATIIKA